MTRLEYVVSVLLLAAPVQAQTLQWDYATVGTIPSTAHVQKATAGTGPWTTIATIPAKPSSYSLTPLAYGFYRILNQGGASNVVQFAAPSPTVDLTPRVSALEATVANLQQTDQQTTTTVNGMSLRLAGAETSVTKLQQADQQTAAELAALKTRLRALETPSVPTSNVKVETISPDQIDITGLNCTALKTFGTGLTRRITCVH